MTGGLLHLALCSLRRHRTRTSLLVAAVGLAMGLPLVSNAALTAYRQAVTARARSTPLLVGSWGGQTDLLLNALYLRPGQGETFPQGALDRACRGLEARAIRLHLKHRAGGYPLVGTDLDYFALRRLTLASGRRPLRLGDCVLGSRVAEATGLEVGDSILSDAEGVLDVVGGFGTRLRITGILKPTGEVDDRAVFCDVKTAWLVDGIGHGHEKVDGPAELGGIPAAPVDLEKHGAVDGQSLAGFHFHGDPREFPLNAAIVVADSPDDALIVRGRLAQVEDEAQAIVPVRALDDLLAIVLKIQSTLTVMIAGLSLAMALLLLLIGVLALRLRRTELATLAAIGVRPGAVRLLIASEWVMVLIGGAAVAAALALATHQWGARLLENMIINS